VLLGIAALGCAARTAEASVISTKDTTAIAAFRAGRHVLNFDEVVVPAVGPCFVPLDSNRYVIQGITIRAKADGSTLTNIARLPGCGDFGATLTAPNIIGGGTGPGSLAWRESVRFDFVSPADAIGASSDWTGSNTTLTAYAANGTVIASVSGDQGNFMGIAAPGIAYAVWKWNFDQSVAGFSLDNVTFSIPSTGVGTHESDTKVFAEPNPFNSELWVRWSQRAAARVKVGVFDVNGRRVASLVDGPRPAGESLVRWDANDDHGRRVAMGAYFIRVELPGGVVTKRAVRVH
jgi:hypothetical protein